MELRKQKVFVELKKELDECRNLGANLLIVTLPGTGMGRMVKEYFESTDQSETSLIVDESSELKSYNLINFDWADESTFEKVEKIFRKAKTDQKIAVTINYPTMLNDDRLLKSFFINHTYRKYYFGLRDVDDCVLMCREINQKLVKNDLNKIYSLSGGLAQLVKYLAVNGVDSRDGVDIILTPVIKAVMGVPEDLLEKLRVKSGGNWVGELLSEHYKKDAGDILIKIGFDLSFEEDGQLNKQKLTVLEKEILKKLLVNKGRLTKEEVSDIKWGDGKYDEFSDQAINKQMRRLSEKLSVYEIKTIPKVGFIIKRK